MVLMFTFGLDGCYWLLQFYSLFDLLLDFRNFTGYGLCVQVQVCVLWYFSLILVYLSPIVDML